MTENTDKNAVPEWVVPGKKVSILSTGGYGGHYGINDATVERLTNTQIVLDNGDKFRRSDLRKIGHTNMYTMTPQLIDPESSSAKELKIKKHKHQLRSNVSFASSKIVGAGSNNKEAAEDLLTKLTQALDEGAYDA